ncbi:MAG: homoserine kinase [Dehalococcoidia bacterium]
MQDTAVTVRVPATSANLGCGFDSLGLALDLFASVTVTFTSHELPQTDDVGERMVITAARQAYAKMGRALPPGIRVQFGVSIPLGRGLGSSAVARVAGALAANEFEGSPLTEEECVAVAAELEGHGDNACPAYFGGVQVCVHAGQRFLHAPVDYPKGLAVAILIPEHAMPTKEARKALPESYSRADAVHNLGRAALFVAALHSGRLELLDEATNDVIHQPQRQAIFPPMFDLFAAAKSAGAHAAWLSGAGSSIAALCPEDAGRAVATAMFDALYARGYPGRSLVTRISPAGAQVARIELVDGQR